MKEADDGRLVQQCLEGNREAFAALIDQYQASIFTAVFRLVHNYDDARDLTQTVFLKAFQNLRKFDFRYRFYSWIYRIAVNESLNFLKREGRLEPITEDREAAGRTPEEALTGDEISRNVQQSLMALPADYRVVIVLRHYAGCSYRDMARILEIPEKTVKSRLFSARRMLKDVLTRKSIL